MGKKKKDPAIVFIHGDGCPYCSAAEECIDVLDTIKYGCTLCHNVWEAYDGVVSLCEEKWPETSGDEAEPEVADSVEVEEAEEPEPEDTADEETAEEPEPVESDEKETLYGDYDCEEKTEAPKLVEFSGGKYPDIKLVIHGAEQVGRKSLKSFLGKKLIGSTFGYMVSKRDVTLFGDRLEMARKADFGDSPEQWDGHARWIDIEIAEDESLGEISQLEADSDALGKFIAEKFPKHPAVKHGGVTAPDAAIGIIQNFLDGIESRKSMITNTVKLYKDGKIDQAEQDILATIDHEYEIEIANDAKVIQRFDEDVKPVKETEE